MSALLKENFISYEEYLAIESNSSTRLEYFDGQIYAMAGGSFNHTRIAGNVHSALKNLLRGQPCSAHNSEQKVRVESSGAATYPDAVVFCPPSRFEGSGNHTLLTPKVIVEVLSPSTMDWDQEGKFLLYQTIPTFTDYLLIRQNRVSVRHLRRDGDEWPSRFYIHLSDVIALDSIGIALPVAEIYEELELPEGLQLFQRPTEESCVN